VTVALPAKTSVSIAATQEISAQAKPESEKPGAENQGLAQSPEQVIAKFGCAACHSIMDTTSPVGPDLNGVGDKMSIDQIRASIIAPNAVIAEGYPPIMPDFSAQMTIAELEMIVQFLIAGGERQTEGQP
jgi:cbb3-type cytochrome oxidase cytochrome c subunit